MSIKAARSKAELFGGSPIIKTAAGQIFPAVAAQMAALFYSLADTWFVGRLEAPAQTAAVTVVYPSLQLLSAVAGLFGVGGAALAASKIGRGEDGRVKEVSSTAFYIGAASSLLLSLLYLIFMEPVLSLCGAQAQSMPYAVGYARYTIVLGGPALILTQIAASLIRAEGSSFAASLLTSLGALLNIALDPLFILGLGMGAAGAGLATAISNAASAAGLVIFAAVRRRRGASLLSFAPPKPAAVRAHLGGILRIGLPSCLQFLLTVVAIAAQARFVSKYPVEAMAGLGIVKKLDLLPLYFSMGVSTGLLPLLAYSRAAGLIERERRAFGFGVALSLGFALCCFAAYELFAPQLARLFINEDRTVAYAAAFLRRMVTAMPLMAVCYPMIIRFQALGMAKEALVCSVIRKGVLDVPLLFLMDSLLPLYGCMWVQPIVDLIALIVCLTLFFTSSRRAEKQW